MTAGVAVAAITGLGWSFIGIVLSRSAKNDFDVAAYGLMQTGVAALLAWCCYARPDHILLNRGFFLLCVVIFAAAVLNVFAQYLVQCAMRSGHYAPVWSMAQAAMVFPFFCGVIFWEKAVSWYGLCGLFLLLAGVILPGFREFRNVKSWFYPALAAFLCYGILQTLYLIPSHVKTLADPGTIRPALACAGNFIGWGIIAASRKNPLKFNRAAYWTAGGMVFIHLATAATFFVALDLFGKMGRGSGAMPFMQGMNLACFGVYSWIFLKEKRTAVNFTAEVLILCGLLLLALQH